MTGRMVPAPPADPSQRTRYLLGTCSVSARRFLFRPLTHTDLAARLSQAYAIVERSDLARLSGRGPLLGADTTASAASDPTKARPPGLALGTVHGRNRLALDAGLDAPAPAREEVGLTPQNMALASDHLLVPVEASHSTY
jgi:hypothetical protein